MVPLAAGALLFFACAKKSKQKKHTPGGTPSALRAPGPRAGREFPYGTSLCHTETPSSMTAPFGFYPARSPCLMGTLKSQVKGVHAESVRVGFRGPFREGLNNAL